MVTYLCRLTEELVKQIKLTIRKELSARHVPSVILEIADIPVSVIPIIISAINAIMWWGKILANLAN